MTQYKCIRPCLAVSQCMLARSDIEGLDSAALHAQFHDMGIHKTSEVMLKNKTASSWHILQDQGCPG